MFRSIRLGLALAFAVSAALLAPGPNANAGPDTFPDSFPLPNGFQPEGIAIGPGPTAWFGSRVDGDIYRVDLRTGDGQVISQGPGPGNPSVGLKSNQNHRLFVAGGSAGTGRVVSTRTGLIQASYQFTTSPSFVNDVLLTGPAAWFTDSLNAQLYALPRSRDGRLPDADEVVTLPLTGEWEQGAGFAANGISQTPDRRALLVVHSALGLLYHVDRDTGVATVVDLGGTSLAAGDGLLLTGRILYVVQNRLNQVSVLRLDRSGMSGELVATITDPRFDTPTTVAAFRGCLYLPNARFSVPSPTPDTTYSVNRVPAHGSSNC
jgi:streptogramin lyase